ncbi:MAG TPA: tetratricopeptide repeat protein [bacterium]|nr:tetratricopeptide repeat protein [bacterium]
MNATTCPTCGVPNPAGAKFCVNCGTALKPACPECGAEVPEGAKFCANCGTRLGGGGTSAAVGKRPVLTEETRKVVTVLFADLVGSTSLMEGLDPEEAREVVKKFYTVVEGVVEEWFGGKVANYVGDAVLAFFGLPSSHEDDPERAVRAGLAIQQAMPVLNTHLASAHGVQLAARVGINTGEVVAASGSSFERDFIVSDAVTTAARLQQTVPAGSVVVGERTHRLTKDAIEYRDLPPLSVKGKSSPLNVWAAVGAFPERPDIRRVTAPLIGRHGELGILRHLYQRSRDDGRAHLVTILGQPGVGKSRLMREFLAEVREKEAAPLVLRGRSLAFGGQIGYHALLDILRFQAGLLDTDASDIVRTKLQAWLDGILPEQRQLLDGLLLTFGIEDDGEDPGRIRRILFEAWRALLTELASSGRPVVLAFEDLHWADDGVLDLVEMLTERGEHVPLFIVCLARPELLERRPSWAGGRRNATNMDLEPLRQHEAEQLVTALGSQGLTPDAVALIAQRAGGNPLFVEELVRMMMEGSAPGSQIPDTVHAVLTARIDRLPQSDRRVLQAASVIGRTFWPSAVGTIAGISVEETLGALGVLVGKELIVQRPVSTVRDEREYAFRHILTRDVAYGMIPKAQRQRAHAEAGRWIEARLGDRVEEVIEILAEHMRVADDDRAAEYLHRAANKARRLYANADALRLFDHALAAARRVNLPSRQVAEILRDRGDVRQLRGEYPAAMADFEAALHLAREAGDRSMQAVLESRVGLVFHRQLKLDDAETHYRRAADIARAEGNSLALGQSLVDLANIAWDRGSVDPGDPSFMEGIALLREAGDPSILARGLNMLAMSHLRVGNGEAAIAAAEEALAAARQAGDKSKEATSLSYLSVINMYLGRYPDAVKYGRPALTLAREIEDRRREAYTMDFLARVQLSVGAWGEAVQLLEDSLPLMRLYARGHVPWGLLMLGMAYGEIGDLERARPYLEECAGIETASASFWQPIVIARAIVAKVTQDRTLLARVIHEMETLPWGEFLPGDAEPLLPVGDAFAALGAYDALARLVHTHRLSVMRLNAPPYLGALSVLEARLADHHGDRNAALRHLDEGVRWSLKSGNVLMERHARELELRLRPSAAGRAALRNLLERLAASLPEELQKVFLASPRVAGVLGGEGGI